MEKYRRKSGCNPFKVIPEGLDKKEMILRKNIMIRNKKQNEWINNYDQHMEIRKIPFVKEVIAPIEVDYYGMKYQKLRNVSKQQLEDFLKRENQDKRSQRHLKQIMKVIGMDEADIISPDGFNSELQDDMHDLILKAFNTEGEWIRIMYSNGQIFYYNQKTSQRLKLNPKIKSILNQFLDKKFQHLKQLSQQKLFLLLQQENENEQIKSEDQEYQQEQEQDQNNFKKYGYHICLVWNNINTDLQLQANSNCEDQEFKTFFQNSRNDNNQQMIKHFYSEKKPQQDEILNYSIDYIKGNIKNLQFSVCIMNENLQIIQRNSGFLEGEGSQKNYELIIDTQILQKFENGQIYSDSTEPFPTRNLEQNYNNQNRSFNPNSTVNNNSILCYQNNYNKIDKVLSINTSFMNSQGMSVLSSTNRTYLKNKTDRVNSQYEFPKIKQQPDFNF